MSFKHARFLFVFAVLVGGVLFLGLASPRTSFAAACQSAAPGGANWSNAGAWTNCGGTTPGAADTVQILNGDVVALDTNATTTSITIDNGGLLYEDGARVLVVSGGWTNNGTFTSGTGLVKFTGTQTITGTTTFNGLEFAPTSAATFTIASGTFATTTGTLTISGSNNVTLNTGNLNAQGNIMVTNSGTGGGGTATITINGTGSQTLTGPSTLGQGILPNLTYNKTSGSFSATGNITVSDFRINAGTFTSTSGTLEVQGSTLNMSGGTFTHNGGTVRIKYSMTLTGSQTFNNLELIPTGGRTLTIASGTFATTTGTLTYGTYSNSSADRMTINTGNIDAQGDITVTNVSTILGGGTATITINGTGAQVFTGPATLNANPLARLPKITIDKPSGTLTLAGFITVAGNWTYVRGTVDATTNDSTVVTIANITFDGQGTSATMAFDNIRVHAGTVTLGGNLDMDGNLTIISSRFLVAADFSVNVAGDWSNSGTYTSGTNTTTFDGSGTSTITTGGTGTGNDFQDFTVDKSGGATAQLLGPLDVDGTLTITAGTLDLNTQNLSTVTTCDNSATFKLAGDETISCTPTNNAGSTVEYTATTTTRNIKDWTYHHLTVNGSGGTFTSGADETIGGNLTVSAGTLDTSTGSRTFTVNNTLTVNGGTLTATNGTLNANRDVSLTSGTLTAPSGVFTVLGNWVQSGGTFTHSSGTVTFASTSVQTLNSGGSTFNAISHNAGGTLRFSTNPLYASSTVTNSDGTFDANDLAVLADGLVTVSGGEYQSKTASSTFSGGLTVSGGTFTGSTGGVEVNGNLALSSGTLTAPSGPFLVSGSWSQTGGTFTPGTGTVRFDGTAAGNTINTGGTSFYQLTVNGSGGAWTLATSNATTTATTTVTAGTLTVPATLTLSTASTTINGGTLTATSGTLDINGNLTLSSGTLTAPSGTMTLSGNFTNSGGTFTHSSGTFTLDGADQTLSGATIFGNLTKTVTSARILTFDNASTQTIAGTLTLQGAATTLLSLHSDVDGTQWEIDPQGTRDISYIDVKDSNNTNATAINCISEKRCTDSGNNTNWTFVQAASAQTSSETTSSGGGGGGGGPIGLFGSIGISIPSISVVETVTPVVETIHEFIEEITPSLIPFIPEIFRPKPPLAEKSPSEAVETVTPPSFAGTWKLLNTQKIGAFAFAPLPPALAALVVKFPELEKTFAKVGVVRFSDVEKLEGVSLHLPSFSEVADLPTEVIFASAGKRLFDYNLALDVSGSGELTQRLNAVSGQLLELSVRPEHAVTSIDGYLTLKTSAFSEDTETIPARSLTAGLIMSHAVFAQSISDKVKIEDRLLLTSFDYADPDYDGVYTAALQAPLVAGNFEVITIITYEDPKLGRKELRLTLVVDPEGYVYSLVSGGELRIENALVTIYWKNEETGAFEIWNAREFQQVNPQTTETSGEYSFLVPPGTYYLSVLASGYEPYTSEPFPVLVGSGVHRNIELTPQGGIFRRINWIVVVGVFLTLSLLYNFYRDRTRLRSAS